MPENDSATVESSIAVCEEDAGIWFNGELYRDDRLFVINVDHKYLRKKSGLKFVHSELFVFKNTVNLPLYEYRLFTKDIELFDPIAILETFTPIASFGGCPFKDKYFGSWSDGLKSPTCEMDYWNHFIGWLNENNLKFAWDSDDYIERDGNNQIELPSHNDQFITFDIENGFGCSRITKEKIPLLQKVNEMFPATMKSK